MENNQVDQDGEGLFLDEGQIAFSQSSQALPAGSPAIDARANPNSLTTDQRGLARPVGAGTDIGSFELQ